MHLALLLTLLAGLPTEPRAVVSGESGLARFPSVQGQSFGGWTSVTRLGVGAAIPAGPLLLTPDLGFSLSTLSPEEAFFEGSVGLRLSLDVGPLPFLVARAGYGKWSALVPSDYPGSESPQPALHIGPSYTTERSQEGLLGSAGLGVEFALRHGVFAGVQLSYERFLVGVNRSLDRPVGFFAASVVARMTP